MDILVLIFVLGVVTRGGVSEGRGGESGVVHQKLFSATGVTFLTYHSLRARACSPRARKSSFYANKCVYYGIAILSEESIEIYS